MKDEMDKALADLTKAIQLDPDGARSYFNRGFAYFRKGDFEKAVADYNDAIACTPAMPRRTAIGATC